MLKAQMHPGATPGFTHYASPTIRRRSAIKARPVVVLWLFLGRDMRQLGEDMNQFAMWQVFCWSARVMCLGISPLPIQASRIGFASSPTSP
jgi:hypothetical protein